MTIDTGLVAAILGVIGLVLGSLVTAGFAWRSHRDVNLTDQLNRVRERLDRSEARERVRDDYIHVLRTALAKAGVPVPEWPDELTHN